MPDEPEVLFSREGHAGIITLNRPKALNALTHQMVRQIHPQLQAWETDPGVMRVIIEGTGEKAFCAGGDVRALYDLGIAQDPAFLEFYREEYRLNTYIKRYPKPYIALIDGIVMGGGVGVSVHGSHRVAGDNIMFAMPETGIGLFPDVGGTYFLPRCPGEIGMYLGLTGARLNAGDACFAGVATHYVQSTEFAELRKRLIEEDDIDAVLSEMSREPEPGKLPAAIELIDQCFSGNSLEDIITNLGALAGVDADWAEKAAATISTKSPSSLKITYRQIREGAKLSFEDCMRLEFRMVNRVFRAHDFFEGTRALIVDKDQNPHWKPAALSDVSDDLVDEYFANLGDNELNLDNLS